MDERTREGLNFFLTTAVVLAVVALLSALVLPRWLHGSVVYVAVVVVATLGAAYGLVSNDVLAEWGLVPLPGPDGQSPANADAVEGRTPKERVENRRAEE